MQSGSFAFACGENTATAAMAEVRTTSQIAAATTAPTQGELAGVFTTERGGEKADQEGRLRSASEEN